MLSDKQYEFITKDLERITLLYGSVRSGKTYISLLKWALWVAEQPKYSKFLMVGKTITSLKRNCLELLESLVGYNNFEFIPSAKTAYLFGRKVWLEGANDQRAENKIRGMTLKGCYIDELTLIPEGFYNMVLSRLSEKYTCLLATTNPDSPNHYVKKNIIDNEKLSKKIYKFLIDDNTFLEKTYIDNLKKEYVGVYYQRFILGNFVMAEGAIYTVYSDNKDEYYTDDIDFDFVSLGLDFGGNKSKHAITAVGFKNDFSKITVLKATSYKATNTTPDHIYKLVEDFCLEIETKYNAIIKDIYCDSAEQVLISGLRANLKKYTFRNAIKKPIIDRIRVTTSLMSQKRLFLTRDCKDLEEGFEQAVYDEKSLNDERLDDGSTNIDILDSFEYAIERYINIFVKSREVKT